MVSEVAPKDLEEFIVKALLDVMTWPALVSGSPINSLFKDLYPAVYLITEWVLRLQNGLGVVDGLGLFKALMLN